MRGDGREALAFGSFGPLEREAGSLVLAWGTGSLGDGDVALAGGSVREGFAAMKEIFHEKSDFLIKIGKFFKGVERFVCV